MTDLPLLATLRIRLMSRRHLRQALYWQILRNHELQLRAITAEATVQVRAHTLAREMARKIMEASS